MKLKIETNIIFFNSSQIMRKIQDIVKCLKREWGEGGFLSEHRIAQDF